MKYELITKYLANEQSDSRLVIQMNFMNRLQGQLSVLDGSDSLEVKAEGDNLESILRSIELEIADIEGII